MGSHEDSETIKHYNLNAKTFYEKTSECDTEKVLKKFIRYMPDNGIVLDLGCGSGRDAKYFIEAGFDVTAVDGSEEMCELASIHIGQDVLQLLFHEIEFDSVFDGVWANASLLHVPSAEFTDIMNRVRMALKVGGHLYFSVRYGDFEGITNGRYFKDYKKHELTDLIENMQGLTLVKIWRADNTVAYEKSGTEMLHVIVRRTS